MLSVFDAILAFILDIDISQKNIFLRCGEYAKYACEKMLELVNYLINFAILKINTIVIFKNGN